MEHKKILLLVQGGLIAAIYVVLGLAFAPISFGSSQIRVAEALTILPALTPAAVPGLTIGCFITNLYGVMSGQSLLGVADIVLGTLATLASAVLTRRLRDVKIKGMPVLSTVFPIVINAVVVGAELAIFLAPGSVTFMLFCTQALLVGLGQLVACGGLGLGLFALLTRPGLQKYLAWE